MIALLLAAALAGPPAELPCVDPYENVETDPIRLNYWAARSGNWLLGWQPQSKAGFSYLLVRPMVGPPAPQTDAEYRARVERLEESSARSRRMLWYVSMNFACAGADLWTTSDAIARGNVEANPFGQTVEKRVGLKLTQAAVSAVANWLIDRAWGAKAGWISASGTAGVQCGAAVHNLTLED